MSPEIVPAVVFAFVCGLIMLVGVVVNRHSS